MLRRRTDYLLERLAEALASDRPLHALWEFHTDPTWTPLMVEFMALGNHREAIEAENARVGQQMRELQARALPAVFERCGIDPEALPPMALAVLMTGIARNVVLEKAGGVTLGHEEAGALVERWLDQVEGAPADGRIAAQGPSTRTARRTSP